ncbi:hypothetical protein EV421DRAFT_984489 [Armillaria borealis]|uniref:DUF6535 domain-containing protein n=1 Tax=Armillaria borealis TaxID=47425 RepID=A0AA39J8D4_9AGAR|nr:hypothetical protein EV421DRAFT_984489 [Armillaria borealis]
MSIHQIGGPSTSDRLQNFAGDEERGREKATDKQETEVQAGEGEQKQDDVQVPVSGLPNAASAASAKKIFGTVKRPNSTAKKGNDPYNYEEKYPEDATYEETASNARVWRTYEDESRSHDANIVEESRDNVDVLLVFAGLFSAVVTTIVAQTYQSLQADYAAMSASLLFELILVQRAIANGSSVDAIAASSLSPRIAFVPTTTDVWVNGLLFTSLLLSLTTALVAVLVKQWLHHYVALPSGTPRDRSFTRQFRYAGFQKWHVQVIIGLLPVLMHLALAIFLVGLVLFLRPLRAALSWIICVATVLVYAAYVIATILPILFPQCPYRTPLCDIINVTFCRIVPRVSWDKDYFFHAWRIGFFRNMIHSLPRVRARGIKSLAMIESESVQQSATNLAVEALLWLFSVSSNPTVQSLVIQSVGGLPMASNEALFKLETNILPMRGVHRSLLNSWLQPDEKHPDCDKPVLGMELKVERLLRFSRYYPRDIIPPDINSFKLAVAIQLNGDYGLQAEERSVAWPDPATFFRDIICHSRSSELPPLCWSHLVEVAGREGAFCPLDRDDDKHTNLFPLHLCSAILCSLEASQKGLEHDFASPLVLEFKDALAYFPGKIYDGVLSMIYQFVRDPPSGQSSLPQQLRVFAAAIEFLLHRLALPESDMSHTIIHYSLTSAVKWIGGQIISSTGATTVIPALEGILTASVLQGKDLHDVESRWNDLCHSTIFAYQDLITFAPSACSLRGLQSMFDFVTINWGYEWFFSGGCDVSCSALADLLASRVPAAYAVFLGHRCLEFFGNHVFRSAVCIPVISEYVAGLSALSQGLDGTMDGAMLQQHIDHLHEPRNLFAACSILATRGVTDYHRDATRNDITALAQLRPQDAAWDECRRKLGDLIENDDGDFFSGKFIWRPLHGEFHALTATEIQVEKDNIRYVISILDAIFNGGVRDPVS